MPNTRTSSIVVRYGQEGDIREPAKEINTGDEIQNSPQLLESNELTAVRAAQAKKAQDVVVLDLREITSLADYFIICTGTNTRQNQAICDEIHTQLKAAGDLPISLEGYENAEWILMDYGDFIVHVFLDRARSFYDLERLWRHAKRVEIPPEPAVA